MPYLLDANVFIEAKNRHYGFDFCPAFWQWIIEKYEAGLIFSTDRIKAEIDALKDELSIWAGGVDGGFFLGEQPTLPASLATLSAWATSNGYHPDGLASFLGSVDFFLIGQALDRKFTVVTLEKAAPTVKKIKIPNACAGVGVSSISTYELLRREGAKFVLP